MEAKYVQGIKAGIIGGVILGFIFIANFAISMIALTNTSLKLLGLVNCCLIIFIAVLMAGLGALAVKMASGALKSFGDALIVSAIAGAVSGLTCAVVYALTQIIGPWLMGPGVYANTYGITDTSQLGLSAWGALGSAICCGPIILLVAIVLAVIGGAIYAAVALKFPPAAPATPPAS